MKKTKKINKERILGISYTCVLALTIIMTIFQLASNNSDTFMGFSGRKTIGTFLIILGLASLALTGLWIYVAKNKFNKNNVQNIVAASLGLLVGIFALTAGSYVVWLYNNAFWLAFNNPWKLINAESVVNGLTAVSLVLSIISLFGMVYSMMNTKK